ncbi:hypothetical protein ACFFVB_15690 [Formosa undariae]|uniref:SGNH/GDSL hydrolase family protein n=1 Tax=Formosa undariae TaxID=1325436 RepID=A0ABV5F516_9FLAO
MKTVNNVDILFLGSSHTYRGFDPRIFKEYGYSTFNLGSSSQTPIETNVLLDRYLDKLNPEMVIYEVYPETFSIDGVESGLDLISNDNNDLSSLLMAFKLKNISVYNTLVFASYRQIFNLDKDFNEKTNIGSDTYIKGGYVEHKNAYYKEESLSLLTSYPKKIQIKNFENILKTLKNKGIKVILVQSPVTKVYYDSYSNKDAFDSLMQKHGEYYNFNELISSNDSLHFYDKDHLNQNGVEIFNRKVLDLILNKEY